MGNWIFIAPIVGVIALIFALFLSKKVSREEAGTDRMKEIAEALIDGAHAFLKAEWNTELWLFLLLYYLYLLP